MKFTEFLHENYLQESIGKNKIDYKEFKDEFDKGEHEEFIKLADSDYTLIKSAKSQYHILLSRNSQCADIKTSELKDLVDMYNFAVDVAAKLKLKDGKAHLYGTYSSGFPGINLTVLPGKRGILKISKEGDYFLVPSYSGEDLKVTNPDDCVNIIKAVKKLVSKKIKTWSNEEIQDAVNNNDIEKFITLADTLPSEK